MGLVLRQYDYSVLAALAALAALAFLDDGFAVVKDQILDSKRRASVIRRPVP